MIQTFKFVKIYALIIIARIKMTITFQLYCYCIYIINYILSFTVNVSLNLKFYTLYGKKKL